MKKKTIITLAAIAGIISFGTAITYLYNSGFNQQESSYIYIDRDDNIDSVRQKITESSKPDNIATFNIFASLLSLKNVRTGRYEIASHMTMLQLVRHIRNHNEKPISLVVPSVRTVEDMAAKLSSMLMISEEELIDYMYNKDNLNALELTKETLPSLFIPNTYEVYWDISVDDLFQRFQKENNSFWNSDRINKIAEVSSYIGKELTPADIVTLASIVDSETANNGEKPNVAGLYLNRLKINMPLQSDPTVIYACQDFSIHRVLHKHLETDSPYNTYKYPGLPPGPIRIPTIAGIDAILNHAHHNYIYMCAKEDFSGTHNFAVTYAEHQRNAALYINALNKKGIKR